MSVRRHRAGANRAVNYLSCFTDEYYGLCQRQKPEDTLFREAVFKIIPGHDGAFEMLRIYFEDVLIYKTSDQLERIKKAIMAANVHIAATSNLSLFALALWKHNGLQIQLLRASLDSWLTHD